MPTHVHCDSCGVKLLAFETGSPKPVGRDDCSQCGGSDFTFVDE